MATEQISVKLPAGTLRQLDSLAARIGESRNKLVVEAVEALVRRKADSAFDRLGDLCGAAQGAPKDGSTSAAWKERLDRE